MRATIGTVLLGLIMMLASVSASGPAMASTIDYQITFAAGSFDPAPKAPESDIVLGQFDIALDTSVRTFDQTSGISLDFINTKFDSPLSYTYLPSLDRLIIGGSASGAASVTVLDNDFLVAIDGFAAGAPVFAGFAFADTHTIFTAGTGTVHVNTVRLNPVVAATPIPGALPLFGSALGGLSFVGWRRRNVV